MGNIFKFRNNAETIKVVAIGLALVVSGAIIVGGFSTSDAIVTQCKVIVSKYVTAEFSSTSVVVDAEGNTSTDVDFWSEIASDVHMTTTVDGRLHSINADVEVYTNASGYFYTAIPNWDKSASRDIDFDEFKKHTDMELTVSVYDITAEEYDYFTDSIIWNSKCIDMLQSMVAVKTWYGIRYGAEWR